MYILFAIIVSLVFYGLLVVSLRIARGRAHHLRSVALGSFLVLAVGLIAFNYTSRAVGVDLGPGRAVTYSIPEDYVARGALGLLALLPYAIACLSPAVAYALLQERQRAS